MMLYTSIVRILNMNIIYIYIIYCTYPYIYIHTCIYIYGYTVCMYTPLCTMLELIAASYWLRLTFAGSNDSFGSFWRRRFYLISREEDGRCVSKWRTLKKVNENSWFWYDTHGFWRTTWEYLDLSHSQLLRFFFCENGEQFWWRVLCISDIWFNVCLIKGLWIRSSLSV